MPLIWEYHHESMAEHSSPDEFMLKRMNELGKEGWDHYDTYHSPVHVLLFKRQVEK